MFLIGVASIVLRIQLSIRVFALLQMKRIVACGLPRFPDLDLVLLVERLAMEVLVSSSKVAIHLAHRFMHLHLVVFGKPAQFILRESPKCLRRVHV